MNEFNQEPLVTKRWTIEDLEAKRAIGDPVADKVVASIIKGEDKTIINELFDAMQVNSDVVPDHFPDYIKEYFSLRRELPEWADHNKIKMGQKLFSAYGSEMCLMLFCKALPQCYSCAKGVQVMYKTERFVEKKDGSFDSFTRRLVETAQFVINVMAEGGFEANGRGIITAQKISLIHAMIRHYVKKSDWDLEYLGEPINQEDLIGTLMSFGALVLDGLKLLNIDMTKEQEDAYIHCWKVAGYIVGVQEDLLPDNADEGREIAYKVFNTQKGYCPESEVLITSLMNYMEYIIPGNRFDRIPLILIRHLISDPVADMVKLPKIDSFMDDLFERFVGVLFKTKDDLIDNTAIASKVYSAFNRVFLQGMLSYYNEFGKVHFYLPESLKKSWKIDVDWVDLGSTPSVFGYRLSLEKKG